MFTEEDPLYPGGPPQSRRGGGGPKGLIFGHHKKSWGRCYFLGGYAGADPGILVRGGVKFAGCICEEQSGGSECRPPENFEISDALQ